jgi:hypothetical protein
MIVKRQRVVLLLPSKNKIGGAQGVNENSISSSFYSLLALMHFMVNFHAVTEFWLNVKLWIY